MNGRTVLAVDIGAESGRVMAVGYDGQHLHVQAMHRFPNTTYTEKGTLYWNFQRMLADIENGIGLGTPLHPTSIGVDTWGVDFALLDAQGSLLDNPVHYRDRRTSGMMERAFKKVPKEDIFARTGIQFMAINTLFQLLSLVKNRPGLLQEADTFLTVPDLINYYLTGAMVCEFTNATTTQLFDPVAGEWARDLIQDLGLPVRIFPQVVVPGTHLGSYAGIEVVAPACHDTGSAVAAVPAQTADFAYISSGTWSLVGVEIERPILTPQALAANVTNEGGVFGTFRLLKNVMGLWVLQQCRAVWAAAGEIYSYADLTSLAAAAEPLQSVFDINDPAFLAPGDHPHLIRERCRQAAQPVPATPAAVARAVMENLAAAYRLVLEQVMSVAGRSVAVIHIVGGGARNELLNQMTADVTGRPVIAGPFEATVIGNGLVQLIALGDLDSLAQARQVVAGMPEVMHFYPRRSELWEDFYGRFRDMAYQSHDK